MREIFGAYKGFCPNVVRLVGSDNEHIGVLSLREAFASADELNMDLVCLSTKSNPPACKIVDYGKFKYYEKKNKVVSRKGGGLKVIKFRPKIENNDIKVKQKKIRGFLTSGKKVKLIMMFRGRESIHKDVGAKILLEVIESLSDVGKPDGKIHFEERVLVVLISPTT